MQALRGEGYGAAAAPDGATALALLDDARAGRQEQGAPSSIGLILLDLRMPGMDGWQFAARYRRTPGPHAPIVVFAAQPDAEAAALADRLGATGFLTKPFELDDLLEMVACALPAPGPAPRVWE